METCHLLSGCSCSPTITVQPDVNAQHQIVARHVGLRNIGASRMPSRCQSNRATQARRKSIGDEVLTHWTD
jgi:hypothetical protein